MPALPRTDPPPTLLRPLVESLSTTPPTTSINLVESRQDFDSIPPPTHVRRQAADPTTDTVIIPTTYHNLHSSPSPGVVAGIVLGSVAGFLLLLLLLYAILGCGFSIAPAAVYSTRRSRRGSEIDVTVMEEVDRSRDRRRRSGRRRSGRHSGGTYAVRTRERVDIIEDDDDPPRAIPVPGPMSVPPPPQQRPRGGGSRADVAGSEDEVVVIEEHERPRRKKRSSRRRSGGEGSRERRSSRRQSDLSEVDIREVRRSVSRRRYSEDD